jgi:AraC-like DNA-binding protein
MLFSPAITVEAVLSGLQASGVDAEEIRKELGLPPRSADLSLQMPYSVWGRIWKAAAALDRRPELPTLVALGIPFGQFGALDYLTGSSETVGGGLQALADHFSAAATGRELEIVPAVEGSGGLRIINTAASDPENDEFTAAVIFGRCKIITNGQFRVERVYLTRHSIAGAPHADLLDANVVYGAAHAGFDVHGPALDLRPSSADSRLHETLLELARKLGLRSDKGITIEVSVRARLRSLLPRGQAVAERVARSLGISERTLNRRLHELGTSFHEVLDQFRMEESERLLLQGKLQLADIALALGFADQATWTRAFRRLRGASPTAWLSHHASSHVDRG